MANQEQWSRQNEEQLYKQLEWQLLFEQALYEIELEAE